MQPPSMEPPERSTRDRQGEPCNRHPCNCTARSTRDRQGERERCAYSLRDGVSVAPRRESDRRRGPLFDVLQRGFEIAPPSPDGVARTREGGAGSQAKDRDRRLLPPRRTHRLSVRRHLPRPARTPRRWRTKDLSTQSAAATGGGNDNGAAAAATSANQSSSSAAATSWRRWRCLLWRAWRLHAAVGKATHA